MNMSVSSHRPLQDLNTPTDFSSLSGKAGQHNGLGSSGSGNQAIDPSALLFAIKFRIGRLVTETMT